MPYFWTLALLAYWLSSINADVATTTPFQQQSGYHNISDVIARLTSNYDVRLRPSFGTETLQIGLDIVIASFDALSEVNMDYTLTLYLNQYWRDSRLAFSNDNVTVTLGPDLSDRIWVPDTFFANDKNSFVHDVTEVNKVIKLRGDGSIAYGMRFTTTLACMLNLEDFPLDIQNCTVEIESYGYTMNDVEMFWIGGASAVRGIDHVRLPQFALLRYRTVSTVERLQTGDYQRLSLSFLLRRNIGYFIFQTYLPSILIVMLSWISFWINHEATSARVALGITTVLTMTTISTAVRSSLPRISYIKAIDIYLLMCFLFVFASLIEFAGVNYTYWGARTRERLRRQREHQKKCDDAGKIGLQNMVGLMAQAPTSAISRAATMASRTIRKSSIDRPAGIENIEASPGLALSRAVASMKPSVEEEIIKVEVDVEEVPKRVTANDSSPNNQSETTSGSDSEMNLEESIVAEPQPHSACCSPWGQRRRSSSDRPPSPLLHSTPGSATTAERMQASPRPTPDLPSVRICSRLYGPGSTVSLHKRRRRLLCFDRSRPPIVRRTPSTSSNLAAVASASCSSVCRQRHRNQRSECPTCPPMQSFRKMAERGWASDCFKSKVVPGIRDVSQIDRVSRIAFPALFLIVNIAYWCFYLLGTMGDIDEHSHTF